jgi:hypothetical protein
MAQPDLRPEPKNDRENCRLRQIWKIKMQPQRALRAPRENGETLIATRTLQWLRTRLMRPGFDACQLFVICGDRYVVHGVNFSFAIFVLFVLFVA